MRVTVLKSDYSYYLVLSQLEESLRLPTLK